MDNNNQKRVEIKLQRQLNKLVLPILLETLLTFLLGELQFPCVRGTLRAGPHVGAVCGTAGSVEVIHLVEQHHVTPV